ncbi:MAG: rod shape-determining protein MreD [Clostridia bacterium]|nr:rod shape-determining protein MreD [Clostridia bacterium]
MLIFSLIMAASLFIALLLQLTVANSMAILGVQPDIVFAVIVSFSSIGGPMLGSICGAATGIFMDIAFLSPGVYSFQYTISGIISGLFHRSRVPGILRPLLICVPAYLIKESAMLLALYLLNASMDWAALPAKLLTGTVYTTFIALALYILLGLLERINIIRPVKDDKEAD